jgi:hypothetical protein
MAGSVVPWHDYSGRDTEDLVAALLVRTVPGAQRIDGSGGDDGVDVQAPVAGGYRIYQIKGFHTRLTASKKRQIIHSLETAIQRAAQNGSMDPCNAAGAFTGRGSLKSPLYASRSA